MTEEAITHEDTQDVAYGNLTPAVNPSQVYSVRIPVDRLEELRRVAESRGLAPSALLRSWVIERLDREKLLRPVSVRALETDSFEVTSPTALKDPRWRHRILADV